MQKLIKMFCGFVVLALVAGGSARADYESEFNTFNNQTIPQTPPPEMVSPSPMGGMVGVGGGANNLGAGLGVGIGAGIASALQSAMRPPVQPSPVPDQQQTPDQQQPTDQ